MTSSTDWSERTDLPEPPKTTSPFRIIAGDDHIAEFSDLFREAIRQEMLEIYASRFAGGSIMVVRGTTTEASLSIGAMIPVWPKVPQGKLTSKPPSLKISFFRSNALVMESLLYDESTPNNINCGLRRTGLDIEKLAKVDFLLSRKEVILLRVVEEPALGSRGLTRRTCSLGGGGVVEEAAAGEEATCA
ncbi:hypothetical protein TNCV_3452081 [Trichonephila clavipes]|nr:hypothetical protein TNCV_3452081 [Trichonephila clavipes]